MTITVTIIVVTIAVTIFVIFVVAIVSTIVRILFFSIWFWLRIVVKAFTLFHYCSCFS